MGVPRPGRASTPRTAASSASAATRSGADVLRRWEAVLTALETDPMSLANQLDWVAKYRLLEGYRERHGLAWDDARLAAMDLQYHDVRPEKSLYARCRMERVLTDDEVELGDDRAAPRHPRLLPGQVPPEVGAATSRPANWDSLVFDLGSDPLRRVPMMEPLKEQPHTSIRCWSSARARPS